jgi:hypothetical protein
MMLERLPQWREGARSAKADADAEALVREHGEEAYFEARRRQRERTRV